MGDENLTIEEVAKILKLSKQTIWMRCKQGQLPAFKIPPSPKWYISRKELERVIKESKKTYDT